MVNLLLIIPVTIIVTCFMEGWAAFIHNYLWHGPLLVTHRSHHRKRTGRFELNDLNSVSQALVAMSLILFALLNPIGILSSTPSIVSEILFSIGLGMTIFGLGYLTVHDGLVHQRLPVQFLARISFLRRVREAHLTHHTWKEDGVPFGLFAGPWAIRRHQRKMQKLKNDEEIKL